MKRFLIFLFGFSLSASAGTFMVITTADNDSEGSLRWAILSAQSNAGPDTIHFNIPETDEGFDGEKWIIQLESPLPNFTDDQTIIQGFTQADNQGSTNPHGPEIVLDGRLLGETGYGLSITSFGNVVSGIGLCGFDAYAISIWRETAQNNILSGNAVSLFILDGDSVLNGNGIYITDNASRNQISGNFISGNRNDAVHISNGHENVIINNRIGTCRSGLNCFGNGGDGIDIRDGSRENVIGGTEEYEGNVISGNAHSGITISGFGTSFNVIKGNKIGIDIESEHVIPNRYHGIRIYGGASRNIVGGSESRGENEIGGNLWHGIHIHGTDTDSNLISGNAVGQNREGTRDWPNQMHGISVAQNAQHNQIGPHNHIRLNMENGVVIDGENTIYNRITQNNIDDNIGEQILLVNGGNMELPAPVINNDRSYTGNTIPEGLVEIFSFFHDRGILYEGSVNADESGFFTWTGPIQGRYFLAAVTDSSGNTSAYSNLASGRGVFVTTTADTGEGSLRWAIELANRFHWLQDTIRFSIPQTDPGFDGRVWRIYPETNLPTLVYDGTVIDGSSQAFFQGSTNPDGPEIFIDGSYSQDGNGISIISAHNVIKGLGISNFTAYGIAVFLPEARYNHIYANYIGTDASGFESGGNQIGLFLGEGAAHNIIGGESADYRNIISGNLNDGIHVDNSHHNVVSGNYIGMAPSGIASNPNGMMGRGDGVDIRAGSKFNRVGSMDAAYSNIISGNLSVGVRLHGEGTDHNQVLGNIIGLDAPGENAVANEMYGVFIYLGAKNNLISENSAGTGNVISGNGIYGVNIEGAGTDSNLIKSNYIGVTRCGMRAAGNQGNGVNITFGAQNNTIEQNLISGNQHNGISIHGDYSFFNSMNGNWIGLGITGADTIPNGMNGIYLGEFACPEPPEHSTSSSGNIISGNRGHGILIEAKYTDYNNWQYNVIGTDTSRTMPLGNAQDGIRLHGPALMTISNNTIAGNMHNAVTLSDSSEQIILSHNRIGAGGEGEIPLPNRMNGIFIQGFASQHNIEGNLIRNNGGYGVRIADSLANRILISENSIADNDSGGIDLRLGANNGVSPPVILNADSPSGTAAPFSIVELFSDSLNQGRVFEGSASADAFGSWVWAGTPQGPNLTATARDTAGNTSAFSSHEIVSVNSDLCDNSASPDQYYLSQNYPNPFNPVTRITFGIKNTEHVRIAVYNLLGQEVFILKDQLLQAGHHTVVFNASGLPSGIYFYRIRGEHFSSVKKMLLLE